MSTRSASPLLLPVMALSATTIAVLQTVVVPVLGTIGAALGSSPSSTGWVLTATLLSAAVLTPVLGRLGDVHGRKPVLLGVLAVVTAGSLLAALTTSLPLLIVARALQGASYALFPLGIGVLRDELPAERLTGAMAVVSAALGVGGGFGLVLTGLLTRDGGDYHRVFLVAAAVTLLALVLAVLVVPSRPSPATGSVDWTGAAVLGTGLVLLLLALSKGSAWGWAAPSTLGSGIGGLAVLAGWLALQRRTASPLVRPELLLARPLLVTHTAALLIGIAMFVAFLAVAGFVQAPASAGYGFSASTLGASAGYLLPGALLGVVLAPIGGRVVTARGPRLVLAAAALLGAAGFALMAALHSAPWELVAGSVLVNGAVSLAFAALPALVVAEVAPADTGVANSVNSIARSVGSSLASAVVVTLLAGLVLPSGLPRESAYVLAFLVGTGACLLAALVVVVGLPSPRRLPRQEVAEEVARSRAGEFAVA